ncbi:MAG: hypothetical protein AVO34_13840 [Firmicutes bacterium ML8_F2]|nr:MAG: hypothetical protein AVO34_13840 [Firmicutes bacterium ML8_F2]
MKEETVLFSEAVRKYDYIAIYIPGSPDPDAIASAYALKIILKELSVEADIFAENKISLTQNKTFIKKLKIPIKFGDNINLKHYQAYIIPDFQSNRVENLSGRIPCAVHLDHHEQSSDRVDADFSLIRVDAGSTSTLVALLWKNMEIKFNEKDKVIIATALTFGIQTDTDKYSNLTSLDIEALDFLNQFAAIDILESLNSMPPSSATLLYCNRAKENEIVYKDWAFYGLGYIDARNRDSIAIASDMLLKSSGSKVVAVFGLVENQKKGELFLDVSLRALSSAIDLNRLIKRITPTGGGRKYKGAYQIKLNYFLLAPDRELLWQLINDTTIEVLQKSRDTLYITGLEGIYSNLKRRVLSILKKDNEID